MSKNEPKPTTVDAAKRFASQKETALGVESLLPHLEGAPPSNTAPPKYQNTEIIRTGIDSLYLSFHGSARLSLLSRLQELKEIAKSTRCRDERTPPALHLAGIEFIVKPKGQSIYPFVLFNNHFVIRVAGEASSNAPPVYMQISSELLTMYGYDEALEMSRKIAGQIVADCNQGTISRVDLCCDFTTDLDWLSVDPIAWVCRSNKRSEYREANELTGYVFGKSGDVLARLYDKTREIELSEKSFFKEIWKLRGWNEEQTVWRLEYQIRQAFLKDIASTNPDIFIDKMNSAWHYLTSNWLSLRLISLNDGNSSRWPFHSDWKVLCDARFNHLGIEDIRRARFEVLPSDYSIFTGALGYLTSFMVKHEHHTLTQALAAFYDAAEEHFKIDDKRHETFAHYVQTKLAEKRIKFVKLKQIGEQE